MNNVNKFIFTILLLLTVYTTVKSQDAFMQAQVPVCAPTVVGGSGGSVFKGEKGDQGVPGKRGSAGLKGERGLTSYPQGSAGCPGVTFHLPRDNQVTDYVQYRAYIPQMKEVTTCAWIETEDYDNHATYYSYATPQSDNELFAVLLDPTTVRLAYAGSGVDISHSVFEGKVKVHICSWYSSLSEKYGFSLNGTEVGVETSGRHIINGGGSLILGQEQDEYNVQSLDASQAWSGNITNFMMWPRVLSSDEILYIATNCDCPYDYSVAMTMDKSELHGEASYSIPTQCPTL